MTGKFVSLVMASVAAFGLFVSVPAAFAKQGTDGKAKAACCAKGAECCTKGAECCAKADCCSKGAKCCKAGAACCAKKESAACCAKKAECCKAGAACCKAHNGHEKGHKDAKKSVTTREAGCCQAA